MNRDHNKSSNKIIEMYYKIYSIVIYFGSLALAAYLLYDIPTIIYFPLLIILAFVWHALYIKKSFWEKIL